MDIVKAIEHEHLKNKIPDLKVGNTVRVHVRIKEGNKERIQVFEGTIIKVQGSGLNKTFTVRKISYGVGVEKTFLIHSPLVEKVELVRVGRSRRAKLFYLRDRVGKSAKTKEVVGARIEDKEIEIKGMEAQEAPVEETVESTAQETVVEPVTETIEQPVAEVVEEPVAEVAEESVTAEIKEEVKEESTTETVEKPEVEAKEVKAEVVEETPKTEQVEETSKKEDAE